MDGGYVLNFSNNTFDNYFADTFGINIFSEKYDQGSGSKANRLRAFWRVEDNHTVGRCVADFIDLIGVGTDVPETADLKQKCLLIADRLRSGAVVPDLNALRPADGGKTFALLCRDVKAAIDAGNPESALDRLHTYVTRYLRVVCAARGIESGDGPLHTLMGKYVGVLKSSGEVTTDLAMQILKNGTKLFDAFNDVRNNRSLAHDNELPSAAESLLIVNHIASTIRFIQTIEEKRMA